MRNYNGNLFLIITHNKYQIFHETLDTGQYELVHKFQWLRRFPYGLDIILIGSKIYWKLKIY